MQFNERTVAIQTTSWRTLHTWLTEPRDWERAAVQSGPWVNYTSRQRRWRAVGLTLLGWLVLASTLWLLRSADSEVTSGAGPVVIVATLAVLYAGMMGVFATGDPARMLQMLRRARVGAVLLMAAMAVATLVVMITLMIAAGS